MENTSDSLMMGLLLFCMISRKKVYYKVSDNNLMNVGSSRIGELLDYLGVKTVTGTTWESGTINGMLCNEKYKGKVQSYYISENHEPIVSPEVWEKVQKVREQRKRDRNIGQDSTMKFQNRYPLSGMLIALTAEKRSGADRFTRRKSNGFAAPTLKRESRHAKG